MSPRPSECLIAISHTDAALTQTVLPGASISSRAFGRQAWAVGQRPQRNVGAQQQVHASAAPNSRATSALWPSMSSGTSNKPLAMPM